MHRGEACERSERSSPAPMKRSVWSFGASPFGLLTLLNGALGQGG